MGAAAHGLPEEWRREARARAQRTALLQRTAVAVLEERENTQPLPHRSGGFTPAQLERRRPAGAGAPDARREAASWQLPLLHPPPADTQEEGEEDSEDGGESAEDDADDTLDRGGPGRLGEDCY